MPTKLTGIPALSYMGVEAPQPPNITFHPRAPMQSDYQNFNTGDMWVDTSNFPPNPPTAENIWMLVSKQNRLGIWVNFSGQSHDLDSLTGDTGGPVFGDANQNINILSGIPGLTVDGNPVTHTLTLNSSQSGSLFQGLEADDSPPNVFPDANGIIYLQGTAGNITTAQDAANNSIIFNTGGGVALEYTADDGNSAVPFARNLNVLGGAVGRNTNTTAIPDQGDTLRIELNNAITLGDLADISLTPAIEIESGDLVFSEPNGSQNPATLQRIIFTPGNNLISFFLNNVFIGSSAGNTTMTPMVALFNIGIGPFALTGLTTGAQNVGIGNGALQVCTDGDNNCAYGFTSLGQLTLGDENIAMGSQSLFSLTTGNSNVALGDDSGVGIVTGSNNTFIGFDSGSDYTTSSSSNIAIGNPGIAGAENNTIRIGMSGAGTGQQNRCFVAGIRGITTGVSDAIPVLIDSAGQLGTASSSLRYKENVISLEDYGNYLDKLRPVSFNYKEDLSNKKRFGLIAEEVAEDFSDIGVYLADGTPESVNYQDLIVILLKEIQQLRKRVFELENKN